MTIKPGGPDIVPEQVVLGGQAEFGINWLDNTLATRDQGGKIVNIAQVFARSGMTEITWKDSGLDSIEDLEGKKVGVWLGGNEHKLFAALNKNGLDPDSDVNIVAQPFDMNLFLNREVDAAAAMTYNELAQVLEQKYDSSATRLKILRSIDGDKTVRGTDAHFLSYRYEDGAWRRRRVFLPEQPALGFTVARGEDADEMQRLCAVYEASDDEGRRLIRMFAELSVSDALQIPPSM